MCRKLNNNIKTYYISRIERMLAWEIYVYLLGGLVVVRTTAPRLQLAQLPIAARPTAAPVVSEIDQYRPCQGGCILTIILPYSTAQYSTWFA